MAPEHGREQHMIARTAIVRRTEDEEAKEYRFMISSSEVESLWVVSTFYVQWSNNYGKLVDIPRVDAETVNK